MELGSLVAVTRHGATCGHHTAYIRKITDSEIPFTVRLSNSFIVLLHSYNPNPSP